MTGVLNAVVGANSTSRHIVVVASPGGGVFGYNGTSGSVTPQSLRGNVIITLYSIGASSLALRLWIENAVLPQSYFTSLDAQDSSGALQRLLSSAATTFDHPNGTDTRWDWTGSGVWTTSHASRLVTFNF